MAGASGLQTRKCDVLLTILACCCIGVLRHAAVVRGSTEKPYPSDAHGTTSVEDPRRRSHPEGRASKQRRKSQKLGAGVMAVTE